MCGMTSCVEPSRETGGEGNDVMRGMTSCVEPSRGPGGREKRLKPTGGENL